MAGRLAQRGPIWAAGPGPALQISSLTFLPSPLFMAFVQLPFGTGGSTGGSSH